MAEQPAVDIFSLLAGLVGGSTGAAVITSLFARKKDAAEADRLKAESRRVDSEARRIDAEADPERQTNKILLDTLTALRAQTEAQEEREKRLMDRINQMDQEIVRLRQSNARLEESIAHLETSIARHEKKMDGLPDPFTPMMQGQNQTAK